MQNKNYKYQSKISIDFGIKKNTQRDYQTMLTGFA